MPRLKILILHRMGDPLLWRKAVSDHEFLLPKHAPDHDYIVHDSAVPLPAYVAEIPFDGILLGPTFLCNRYKPRHLARVKKIYDFIRYSEAFKIALPQDDYNCSHILDDWLIEWKVDLAFAVIDQHWDLLYPRFSKTGKLRLGYTGYIHEEWIQNWATPRAFQERTIDVSYRSGKLPPSFGYIGYEKSVIGERFVKAVRGHPLTLDISNSSEDIIPGEQWHAFVENSKFCLGSNSGSSLIDARGEIRQATNRYLALHPEASFEEVEAACFPGKDHVYALTAISPRAIEAGLALTTQISVPGSYSGILRAHEHYIPLDADCSNIEEVLATMADTSRVQKISADCKDALLSHDVLRSKAHASALIDMIANHSPNKHASHPNADKLLNRYYREIGTHTRHFWRRHRVLKKSIRLAKRYGGQRLINFFNI
ncbi:MAG: hypothetical protein ACFCU4_02870 [Puniceicoccaceae bacterium]